MCLRVGLGVGFVAAFQMREDPDVVRVLPDLPLPRPPVWLVVHREIRSSRRVRAMVDFLARELPSLL
jgi:DNA-binding transcriptional LysR family regulator